MKHIKSTMPIIMRIKGVRCAIWKHNDFMEITAQTDEIEKILEIEKIYKKNYRTSSFSIHNNESCRKPHAHIILRK